MIRFETRAFYPREENQKRLHGSHRVGGWVGQRVSLDALEKERDLSCTGIEPGFVGRATRSVVSVVTELCCRVMRDFNKDCCRACCISL